MRTPLLDRPHINYMLRAGTNRVLGRGRMSAVLGQVPLARVLTSQRAGADLNR